MHREIAFKHYLSIANAELVSAQRSTTGTAASAKALLPILAGQRYPISEEIHQPH